MTRRLVILGTTVTVPDPASVTDLAAGFREQGGQLADLEETLQALNRSHAWGEWTGQAADTFGQSLGQLPGEVAEVRDAYGDVASVLQRYAAELEPVVSALSSLSFRAEDAEGNLQAVSTACAQAKARGENTTLTGWDTRLADAKAAVTSVRVQLNRLITELTSLAATCTKQITAAEPKKPKQSLFGKLESGFVRDIAHPVGRIADDGAKLAEEGGKDAGHLLKDAGHLLGDTFVKPFRELGPALEAYVEDPNLHTAGELLSDFGDAVGVVALALGATAVVVALTVGTGGAADVVIAGALSAGEVAGDVAVGAHIDALGANTGAVISHEDDASWSEVGTSALSVTADAGGEFIDDDPISQTLYGVGSGLEVTAFSDVISEHNIPEAPAGAPDVVSGLQMTAGAVQGLQGLPDTPAVLGAGGSASVLQPAASVPSPAVVNIQHVTLGSGPEMDK